MPEGEYNCKNTGLFPVKNRGPKGTADIEVNNTYL